MSKNITTLILNLFIAERFMHRQNIADHIKEILTDDHDGNALEAAVRKLLLRKVRKYIENPTQESKDVLFAITEFYCDYFYRTPATEMQLAA